MRVYHVGIAAAVAMALASPAAAQFSESYNFLKAVKDRDGTKVTEALDKPGTSIVNTRGDDGDTALHIVTKRRDLTWVQFIVANNAKVDARDRDGNTPLAIAAQIGFPEAVRYLATRQTVNLPNNRGETPLILAVQARDLATVRTLLSLGANPKQADRVTGKSAIDYAAEDRRATAIAKLLEDAPKPTPASGPIMGPGG
ncbi:ankyrin repeat domain-containing protein [Sphingomonas jatrophae]|uniref:Ankyrin repeat-containing protein n=1 Tax=Sphingomonas jatrophae TaxID=1166337 RepID=A0A1I6LPD7_9SPHN|nr:ankyrin repeat domain-containing protein [Sphingomonas jatrophae]SFS05278.1 Ankyrin repeat-containing protein [Sphingomonas jatrophae]